MFIKPAEGLKVRDPVKKDLLPEDGRQVGDHDLYWMRRLRDKDVVLADQPMPANNAAANAVRKTPAADPAPTPAPSPAPAPAVAQP